MSLWSVRRLLKREVFHQTVDVLNLSKRAPSFILPSPVVPRLEPHRKGFRKIFRRMRLGIPCIEIENVIAAAGLRLIPLGIGNAERAEHVLPASTGVQPKRIVQRVSGLMPQDSHTLAFTGS